MSGHHVTYEPLERGRLDWVVFDGENVPVAFCANPVVANVVCNALRQDGAYSLSAARAEALEEAARVCEELAALARKSGAGAGMIEGYVSAAAMLRALAQKARG